MDNQVTTALKNLIIQKSTELMESTNPEELAALAELVQSYTTLVKEVTSTKENIENLVKEKINQEFHSLKKLFDGTHIEHE